MGCCGWAVLSCAGTCCPAGLTGRESWLWSIITTLNQQERQRFPGIYVCTGKMIYVRNDFSGRKRKDVLELRAFTTKAGLS